MADPDDNLEAQDVISDEQREEIMQDLDLDPVSRVEFVYHLWWTWANFELFIIEPELEAYSLPTVIPPQSTEDGSDVEFVYPIFDFNHKFGISKAEEMFSAGRSNCKLFYTIEKIIALLVERLNAEGLDTETEVQIAFEGHELAQRKAFESVINLNYNVIVTNFDPGVWGERYLQTVKRIADKGYGYPPEAPRDTYRHTPTKPSAAKG